MILLTGAKGQLGLDIIRSAGIKGEQLCCTDFDTLDITDGKAVSDFIQSKRPEAVIHCAAYTAVDKAEEEKEKCLAVNVQGTRNIAEACESIGAKLVYISTDYVFNGNKADFYLPGDKPDPLSVYGKSKLMGEEAAMELCSRCFIVRTSWVYGSGGGNFIRTMLRLSTERDLIKVVADQFGSPTYTRDLAPLLLDIAATEKYGIYHATNEGFCSWYDLAAYALETAHRQIPVIPIKSSDYRTAAARPLNSCLSKDCLDEAGFSRLPDWRNAVERFIAELDSLGLIPEMPDDN